MLALRNLPAMVSPSLSGLGTLGFTGYALKAADDVTSGASTVQAYAALITALGGVLIALTTLILGLRAKKDTKDDERDELINELLIEKLLAEREAKKKENEGP